MIKSEKGKIIGIVIVICVVTTYLIYTCSQTIEQRYPSLNILDCTEIKVYYSAEPDVEDAEYIIDADDSRFFELLQLIQSAETRKKLSNIFPQGTRTHILASGDFKWELMLQFDDALYPSGAHGSGYMLHLRNFFGDFSVSFDGKQIWYSVRNQQQWLNDIKNTILLP